MRHGFCRTDPKLESPHYVAFKAYSNSISTLQAALLDPDVTQKDDVILATFFLGLFELMVDPSGEGWTKHMLSGTCKLLQLAGPRQKMTSLRKLFFGVFRVLEASRAVLYGDSTMLSHPDWLALQQTQASTSADDWDSLGSILSLMIQISKFNFEFFGYAESMVVTDHSGPFIDQLGTQGVEIQDSLYQWLCKAKAQLDRGTILTSGSRQAFAYAHALLIFQFNSFDYYQPYWSQRHAPRLSQLEIDHHIDSILEQSEYVLNEMDVSGVLFFFPLRVAGTRARSETQRARILRMLDGIFKSGFVVSKRIETDLQELWNYKNRLALAFI